MPQSMRFTHSTTGVDAAFVAIDPALEVINKDAGYKDVQFYFSPCIDTRRYLPWLKEQIERRGGTFRSIKARVCCA